MRQLLPGETPEERQAEARRLRILRLARAQLDLDDDCELDSNAQVSEGGENGAFVQTWSWVSFDGTPLDKETR